MSTTTTLEDARTRIDEINERVVKLLAERQAIVDELCEIKAEAGQSVRDPEREAELLDHVRAVADDAGLSPDLAEALFEEVLAHSVRQQRRRRDEEPGDAHTDPASASGGSIESVAPERQNGSTSSNGQADPPPG